MNTYLENTISNDAYDDFGNWILPDLQKFSEKKTLYSYQREAIKNITKVLKRYFTGGSIQTKSELNEAKLTLFDNCRNAGLSSESFRIKKYETRERRRQEIENKRFNFFKNYFSVNDFGVDEYINGHHFFNRAAFWMATGSGKSLVLIKTIELLDYLQSQNLIPKKEIMLLLPREDLIKQFKKEILDFNKNRERKIDLINLKKYEDDKNSFDFANTIKVYYYRSDLMRNKRKEKILDYRTYENNGNWYVFLDEAHRGKKEDSLMQDYVTVLSHKGFLFNFSATFTDSIDYTTTCYNFNLEKFIENGYGKNLYLSQSYFTFTKDKDDFSEKEKQKQVLKSLIVFSLIKEFYKELKKYKLYHNPLLITLVNSINTDDSDLLLLFKKIEEIASDKLDKTLFSETKKELIDEFSENTEYVFGNDKLEFDTSVLENLKIENVLENVFNTRSIGKIEILEGEKGKEIVLKLETAEKPFALIKIGDAKKFQREKLGENYSVVSSFDNKKVFENINESEDINLLLGSRSFYEGWDSNRPNVINMINIGKKDAKKFVLQGIGRGIRIEPKKGERQRLKIIDLLLYDKIKDKVNLLESLFVFATDKNAVKAIIETVEEQQNKEEYEIQLEKNPDIPFDLLIPVYKKKGKRDETAKFSINKNNLKQFKKFISFFDDELFLMKYNLSKKDLVFIKQKIESENLFQFESKNEFLNLDTLIKRIISFTDLKAESVNGVKEISDEIIHFKQIKVINFSDEEIDSFKAKISNVIDFEEIDENELDALFDKGKISREKYKQKLKSLGNTKNEESFKDLKIQKISQHYYLPIIYSQKKKIEYIKHIVTVPSEVNFIKNLVLFIKENEIKNEWMFSKIVENIDENIYIPYLKKKDNAYHKFFPDFIFWIKSGDDYKIVFVDPKGTSNTAYQNKVDEFEKLFIKDSIPKTFSYKNYSITFDLKLIANDINSVGEKYKSYWLGKEDLVFLCS